MNNINITGRLCGDPELRKTSSDISVCSFTLAVKRPKVKDTTDFINCTAFRQSADYLTTYGFKGNLVAVSGILTSRKYQDKNGNNRVAFEVVCDNVELCESKKEGSKEFKFKFKAPKVAPNVSADDFEEIESDELPF